MSSKISLIIGREYFERVKKKSFIITTILMPLFMILAMALPALIMMFSEGSKTKVLVVDNTDSLAKGLESDEDVTFTIENTSLPVDSVIKRADVDAVLVIPEDVVSSKNTQVKLYSNGPSGMKTEMFVTRQLNELIEKERLKTYNIENLKEIMDDVESNLSLTTIRLDEESEETTSSMISYFLGIAMSFILYMFLLMYGQMVMTSIIEEKTNRVLEIVVSSVRPMQLMLGKIAGIALVAITQIVIWGVLLAVMSAVVLPMMISPEMSAEITAYQSGQLSGVSDVEMVSALSMMTQVGSIVGLLGIMTLFLIFGFLLYAAIFAAIGSSVDNVNDASQLTSFAVFPIIFGIIFSTIAGQDPTSSFAFWTSMIPFTSPMVMVARIPYGIPAWEIVVSLALLVIGFVALVWLAGKIYRVGIFMYGKKPSIKEICKWITYK